MDLQQISDRIEIQDVLTRYTRAIDEGQWDGLDTVFTPDAQIDYTESGGIAGSFPEAKKWLAETLPAFFTATLHTIGQVSVEWGAKDDEGRDTARSWRTSTTRCTCAPARTSPRSSRWAASTITRWCAHRRAGGASKLHEELVWKRGL